MTGPPGPPWPRSRFQEGNLENFSGNLQTARHHVGMHPSPGRPTRWSVTAQVGPCWCMGPLCACQPSQAVPRCRTPLYYIDSLREHVWRRSVSQRGRYRCGLLELGLELSSQIPTRAHGCRAPSDDIKAAARWRQPGPQMPPLSGLIRTVYLGQQKSGERPRNCLDSQG